MDQKAKKPGFWENLKNACQITAIVTGITAVATKAGLALSGFSSIGPVAGSFAAAVQSTIGSVGVGSSFAVVQGIAMLGFPAIILPALIVGAVVGAAWVAYQIFKK